jgi:Ca2+/Na+ antiporter
MTNSFFWLIYLALIFWTLYQKLDAKIDRYTKYPYLSTLYFLIFSVVLLIFFPHALKFFYWDGAGILTLLGVVLFTLIMYKVLKKIKEPKVKKPIFSYFQLLDERYVFPKLAEVIFQQTFFVSAFVLSIDAFGLEKSLYITIGIFILAHLNLFVFQSMRRALFFFLASMVGAPIFIMLIIKTELLWYSISLHFLFYTVCSFVYWSWNVWKSR